jgi:hypothetical protein
MARTTDRLIAWHSRPTRARDAKGMISGADPGLGQRR